MVSAISYCIFTKELFPVDALPVASAFFSFSAKLSSFAESLSYSFCNCTVEPSNFASFPISENFSCNALMAAIPVFVSTLTFVFLFPRFFTDLSIPSIAALASFRPPFLAMPLIFLAKLPSADVSTPPIAEDTAPSFFIRLSSAAFAFFALASISNSKLSSVAITAPHFHYCALLYAKTASTIACAILSFDFL